MNNCYWYRPSSMDRRFGGIGEFWICIESARPCSSVFSSPFMQSRWGVQVTTHNAQRRWAVAIYWRLEGLPRSHSDDKKMSCLLSAEEGQQLNHPYRIPLRGSSCVSFQSMHGLMIHPLVHSFHPVIESSSTRSFIPSSRWVNKQGTSKQTST